MDLNISGDRSSQWQQIQEQQGVSSLQGAGPAQRAWSKDTEMSKGGPPKLVSYQQPAGTPALIPQQAGFGSGISEPLNIPDFVMGGEVGGGAGADETANENSMAFDYSQAFEGLLQNSGIDEKTVNQLRYMHYHPEVNYDDPGGRLQGQLSQLEGKALNQIQGKYGFPKGFEPKPNSARYDAEINAKYLSNPMDLSIFMTQMGLPEGWQPPPAGIDPTPGALLNTTERQIMQNIIDDLETQAAFFESVIDDMPDGSEKDNFLDYMKDISEALTALKEFLYEIQSLDSAKSRELSELTLKMSQDKVEKMTEKLDKMEKSRKKEEANQLAMKIFGWIMAVVSLVLGFLMGGPVGLAIALAFFIDKVVAEVTGKPSLLSQMFKAVQDAIPSEGGKIAATIALTIVLAAAAGPAGAATSISIVTVALAESKLVQLIAKNAGANSKDQEIAAMVAMLIIAIVGAIAGGAGKGLAKAPKALRPLMKKFSSLRKVFQNAKLVKNVRIAAAATNSVVQAANEFTSLSLALQRRAITLEVGQMDADIEFIDEMMKIIKKLINALLSGQGDMSQLIDDIQGALQDFYGGASKAFAISSTTM